MNMQICSTIRVKDIVEEDFINYKKPSMFIATITCNWKCCKEQNLDPSICQNSKTALQKTIDISIDKIIDRYINNEITQAIVIGGLEPFLQFEEILNLIKTFRKISNDDIVIYTGYYPYELENEISLLKQYGNIIVKFGRYKPNQQSKYDNILGVTLASDNQYAKKIS